MNPLKSLSMVFALLIGLFLLLSVFIVNETERAIVLRLGKMQQNSEGQVEVLEPGLHFKVPFVDSVRYFDRRIRTLNMKSSRIPTEEKKELIIDLFNKWRIKDFATFFRTTGGDKRRAEQLLSEKTNDGLRTEIGRRKLTDVVSSDRDLIMAKISKEVSETARTLGIEVVDARVIRIDLPPEVSDAVFGLMRTERKQVAESHRANGRSRAEELRANADAQVTVILAQAEQKSQETRGEGDALAARVFETAYSKDPEFFRFLRSLDAYKRTFNSKNDMLVLKPDSDFFNYFQSIDGQGSKPAPTPKQEG